MAALQKLAPEFLQEGRLYWLRTPLYIVQNGKINQYFYSDEEFDAVRATIKGEVTRAKGLGALNAKRMKESMFTKEHQRLDQLKPEDDSISLLYQLMGEDVNPRKDFVFKNVDFSTIRE